MHSVNLQVGSTSPFHQSMFSDLVTDVGVASLSEALKQSTYRLTTLDLIQNQITDPGLVLLPYYPYPEPPISVIRFDPVPNLSNGNGLGHYVSSYMIYRPSQFTFVIIFVSD